MIAQSSNVCSRTDLGLAGAAKKYSPATACEPNLGTPLRSLDIVLNSDPSDQLDSQQALEEAKAFARAERDRV